MKKLLWFVLIITIFIFSSCGQPVVKAPPKITGASSHVAQLYQNYCISCHGADLRGRVGNKTDIRDMSKKMTREQLIAQITKGSPGMPGFEKVMTAEEIENISDWLLTYSLDHNKS